MSPCDICEVCLMGREIQVLSIVFLIICYTSQKFVTHFSRLIINFLCNWVSKNKWRIIFQIPDSRSLWDMITRSWYFVQKMIVNFTKHPYILFTINYNEKCILIKKYIKYQMFPNYGLQSKNGTQLDFWWVTHNLKQLILFIIIWNHYIMYIYIYILVYGGSPKF